MTIEPTTKDKRVAALEKARAAKAAKKEAAESPSRQMDAAEIAAKRARLIQELADLPSEAIINSASTPGEYVKDGLGPDKIPWTPARLRAACSNNEVLGGHQFSWKEIIGQPEYPTVSWNGIVYWLFAGQVNKVPSVHYALYMQMLEDKRREQEKWAAPANPGRYDGYQTGVHVMGVGPLEPRSTE